MKFWTIRNQADNPEVGEVLLYGVLANETWWGDEVTPKQFKEDLDGLGDVSTINVYINSPGGDLFAGQAIYSMLKRRAGQVNVYIDGMAASAASIVAMAGDTVYMPSNAMMIIHNAWTIAAGNANDLREIADQLEHMNKTIISVYMEKTGLSEAKITELLDAETLLLAHEAKELGFVDEIEAEKKIAAMMSGHKLIVNNIEMDFSRYPKFSPAALGKVLSSANEGKIQQSRDLLDDVLTAVKPEESAEDKVDLSVLDYLEGEVKRKKQRY